MTAPTIRTTETFALDAASDDAHTSVVAIADDTDQPTIGPVESLVAYLYDDLRTLARVNPDLLAEALHAPDAAAEDPNLFLKLVCADLEQLFREQHIRALALVVSGPDIADPIRHSVYARALYRVERPLDPTLDLEDVAPLPPLTRTPAYRPLAAYLIDGAALTLLLDWSSQSVKRGPTLRHPPYQFLWVRAAPAHFTGDHPLPSQPVPSAPATNAGWHVTTLACIGGDHH